MVLHQVLVSMLAVLRVERVVTYHVQCWLWQIVLYYMIQVFIMPPTHMYIFQSTAMFIYAILCIVAVIVGIGVCCKVFRIYNLIGVRTANRECVTYHCPL